MRALERHRTRVEPRRLPAGEIRHLHVVDVRAAIGHDGVPLDALDLEPRAPVRGDRPVVVGDDAQGDPVEAEVLGEVPDQQRERLATEATAPERLVADPDPDLRAPCLWHEVAIVREAHRPAFVLDDEEAPGRRLETRVRDEGAGRRVVRPAAPVACPLVPDEIRVGGPAHEVPRVLAAGDAQGHPRAAQDRAGRDGHGAASATVGLCGPKSGGSAFVSRSAASRSTSASSATPRSSSREPRRRTETVRDSASLSPTMSM